MSGTFSPSVRIGRALATTNSGVQPRNASGLTLGENFGAFTASQEGWIFQNIAGAGNQPFYRVGLSGVSFINGAINIPSSAPPIIFTLPAGATITGATIYLLQSPTAITGGTLTLNVNSVAIGSFAIGVGLGGAIMTFSTSLAGLRLLSYVGNTDAVVTATLAGTGITGGILASVSVQYTAKNADGTVRATGIGLTNTGA